MRNILQGRYAYKVATTAALFVAATGVTFTVAPTANATATTNCSQSSISSVNGEGAAYLTANRNLKTSFYGDCANVRSLGTGSYVYLRCFHQNEFGNVWWYARPEGDTALGWLSEDDLDMVYLDDNGDGHMTYLECYP